MFQGDQIQMHWGVWYYLVAPCRDLTGGHLGTRPAASILADRSHQPVRTLSVPFLRARPIPNSLTARLGLSRLAVVFRLILGLGGNRNRRQGNIISARIGEDDTCDACFDDGVGASGGY